MKLTKLIDILQAKDNDYDDMEIFIRFLGDYDPDIRVDIEEVNGRVALVIS